MSVTQYCTITDVQNRLSSAGVTLRTDDSPPTTYGDVLDEAAVMVNQYCQQRYTPVNLALSDIVNTHAANIATWLLCTRRGNPAPGSINARYEKSIEYLEKIQLGFLNIGDIAERRVAAPGMTNVEIKLRPRMGPVVQRATSTGTTPTDYAQRTDRSDPLNYVDEYYI